MSYQYEKTEQDLYRALFKDNYDGSIASYLKPDKDLADAKELLPILHPPLEARTLGNGSVRPPDIVLNRKTQMYDPDTGGTSVFDRPGVLRRSDGDFCIPEGTDLPPDLKIKKDEYNKRLKATHYSIMPSKPLYKNALLGQLDNLVRSAIRRQWEKARGI